MSEIFAIPMFAKEPLNSAIQALCFGSCNKISACGMIDTEQAGPCWVCCEEVCPHLEMQTGVVGTSEITGDEVRIRIIKSGGES